MACHDQAGKPAWRRAENCAGKFALAAGAVLGLACCSRHGNFDTPDPPGANAPTKLVATFLGLKSSEAKSDGGADSGAQSRHIFCPEVIVLEGTAASRVYAGAPPSSANLRYQTALNDTARECSLEGKELAIKIGVAGKVLLGPAGAAGNFSVPVRMAVLRKRDNEPIVSKLYHAAVTVPSGKTQADFTIISEPLHVPFIQDHAEDDYTIRVGIDAGPSAEEKGPKGAKR